MVAAGVQSKAPSAPSDTEVPRRCRSAILKVAVRAIPSEKKEIGHHTIWQPLSRIDGLLVLVQQVGVDYYGIFIKDTELWCRWTNWLMPVTSR